jgi:lipopolysaccharide export system ATP-binding protein
VLKILPFGSTRTKTQPTGPVRTRTQPTGPTRSRRNGASPSGAGEPQLGAEGWLTVHHVQKSYKKRTVVRGVSLAVGRGESVGLLGPNGAGKTTCFYAIAGLVPPDRGTILVDGQDVTWLPMYRRAKLGIGYLPQEASIFRGMTVADNIRSILEITIRDAEKRNEMLDELMGEFSITHLRRAPAIALSGGERRRVEIAWCRAAQPKYVLLDEPFAGVDPLAVMDIRQLVHHLKDRGLGVLITDHNVRETLEIVDRAYILHDGGVLMTGTPEEVVRDDNVRRVYLGESFRI